MNKHQPTGSVQLNIKSAKARQLADDLAQLTGQSLTDAVTLALEDRLAKERLDRRRPGDVSSKLTKLAEEISSHRLKDNRTADEIIGYDEHGLPT